MFYSFYFIYSFCLLCKCLYIYLAVTSLFDISEFASKLSIEQLAGLRSHINIELKTIISMTKKAYCTLLLAITIYTPVVKIACGHWTLSD